jgi:hypothetical protein
MSLFIFNPFSHLSFFSTHTHASEVNVKPGTAYGINSCELHYPLRIRIKNLDAIPFDPKLLKLGKKKEQFDWRISIGVYHAGQLIKNTASIFWVFRFVHSLIH